MPQVLNFKKKKIFFNRLGLAENTWIQPTHLVTYYRYLRFFSDGSCITLLTVKEPTKVVKNLNKFGHTLNGRWKFLKNDDISKKDKLIIWANDNDLIKFTFQMKFEIKSTLRGKFNKLRWIGMLFIIINFVIIISMK